MPASKVEVHFLDGSDNSETSKNCRARNKSSAIHNAPRDCEKFSAQNAYPYAMPFNWVGLTAKIAELDGINIKSQMELAGVAGPNGTIDNDTNISPAAFLLMCILVINEVGDEMHGVTRSRMVRGTAASITRLLSTRKSLGLAIETLSQFFESAGSYCKLRLVTKGDTASVQILADGRSNELSHIVEEMMGHFLLLQFTYFLQQLLPLTSFSTPASRHPFLNMCHPFLLAPVRRDRVTSLNFPTKFLSASCQAQPKDRPFWAAHSFWLEQHPYTDANLFNAHDLSTLGADVYNVLREMNASFSECCNQLSISMNDLKRGLLAEGTNFRKIRRAVLIESAAPSLRDGASADDVASELGYSDARSFRRALKLAGGPSISQLRDGLYRSPPQETPKTVLQSLEIQAAYME